ncbi:hypothetical protein GCM10009119_38000 [Algoriphagus jejuensis]|uniref:PH (Pleckstrin Homology) domain-containing protein n=1 Tax=Algoriphagus jejuensis TaxID=419934 RepID=A0ABN1N4H4_9BACT
MITLVISIISILILMFFISVFLVNTRTSSDIDLQGNRLTVRHPLKKEEIHLKKDLKTWNVRKMNLLWRGRVYALNLELKGKKWTKIYFVSKTKKIKRLIDSLEEFDPNGSKLNHSAH